MEHEVAIAIMGNEAGADIALRSPWQAEGIWVLSPRPEGATRTCVADVTVALGTLVVRVGRLRIRDPEPMYGFLVGDEKAAVIDILRHIAIGLKPLRLPRWRQNAPETPLHVGDIGLTSSPIPRRTILSVHSLLFSAPALTCYSRAD
jgi:hypothetical protein